MRPIPVVRAVGSKYKKLPVRFTTAYVWKGGLQTGGSSAGLFESGHEKMPTESRHQLAVFRYQIDSVHVCAAPLDAVVQTFGSFEKFVSYFAGGLTYGRPSTPEFLGVWGARSCGRFRRLLRDSFGKIEIVEGEPPARLTICHTIGERPHRLERINQEATFAQIDHKSLGD